MGKGGVRLVKRAVATAKWALFLFFANLQLSADSLHLKSSYTDGGRLSEGAYEIVTAIRADTSILCPKERYALGDIDYLLQNIFLKDDALSKLNERLSRSFSLYRKDREKGCIDPYHVYPDKISIDYEHLKGIDGENILLRRLEKILFKYEKIVENGGWKRVDNSFGILKKGDFSKAVGSIKERLYISGDYNQSDFDNYLFTDSLKKSVALFQKRHSIKSDGIVGPQTVTAMNISADDIVKKIKINIERLRWLTGGTKEFIAVNIPSFTLELYKDEKPQLSMKCIVGRKDRPTPMVSDLLTYAVLNPYWRVPKSIVKKDILPKLKDGKIDYLKKIGISASKKVDTSETVDLASIDWSRYSGNDIPFIFMQKPGPMNYLGLVKFMFPNPLDIYIHDTPKNGLFKYRNRLFSSGCIRAEKPIELFHAILKIGGRSEWSYKRIFEVLMTRKEKLVGLPKPIPVYILYMTAYADENLKLFLYPDIYGYDKVMQEYIASSQRFQDR
ncbi:MAG: L,D-transpeptidase family protein [Hydrogenimonas sp.]|nr:L,D-transpeptidase family protein [Hydrogenimonas sp.]